MEEKYSKVNNITLYEIETFFSSPLFNLLQTNGINTLKELFEFFDKKESINVFFSNNKISPSYKELLGIVKLLKYKHLGIDPNFTKDSTLEELGFSARAIHGIILFKKYNKSQKEKFYQEVNIPELINLLSDEEVIITQFSQTRTVGSSIIEEVKNKVKILTQYYKENNLNVQESIISTPSKDISNTELKELFELLKTLTERNKLLNDQILIVQEKINKILIGEETNEPNRKK